MVIDNHVHECDESSDCDSDAFCDKTLTWRKCIPKVNECLNDDLNDCNVNAECTDTDTSYTCTCKAGFIGDGITCDDIDECASDPNLCHINASCINTPGSYECKDRLK